MLNITRVGVDIAKLVFHVHGVDRQDRVQWRGKKGKRDGFIFAPAVPVFMSLASGGRLPPLDNCSFANLTDGAAKPARWRQNLDSALCYARVGPPPPPVRLDIAGSMT